MPSLIRLPRSAPKVIVWMGRWGRGKTGGKLANARGRQNCCLAFACKQLHGVSYRNMRLHDMPHSVLHIRPGEANGLRSKQVASSPLLTKRPFHGTHLDSKLSKQAAKINDNFNITDVVRKRKLRDLFAASGIRLVFKPGRGD